MRGLVLKVCSGFTAMLLALPLAGLSLALLTPSVSAQTDDGAFNLVTSPLPINLTAKPGTTVTTDIRVKNGGTRPERLKVSLMKFAAFGEEGKPSLTERQEGDDYFDWVSFSPEVFEAPPNEWVTVKMSIALPDSAAFGYYYAAVFSRASNPEPTASQQNVLVGSTAVLVLVEAQVPGAKRQAKVVSFTASKSFYEFLPANFSIKVRNSGNVHLIPAGDIFISRGKQLVSTVSINSAAGNVLPNSNRIFTGAWTDGFPIYTDREQGGKVVLDEAGKPVKDLKWELNKVSKLRFGRYTARLLMVYDDGSSDVPMEATVSFWVIPWRVIGVGLVILVLMVIGLWSTFRNLYRKFRKGKNKKNAKNT